MNVDDADRVRVCETALEDDAGAGEGEAGGVADAVRVVEAALEGDAGAGEGEALAGRVADAV